MFTLVVALIVLLIFQAGFAIGFRKAAFSFNWNKNYINDNNFDDPRSFMAPFMHDSDDINPHGAVGEIISINLPTILLKRSNGPEEIIHISTTTEIRNLRQTASTSDLTLHKLIIVIGEANNHGQIDAALVRILPTETFGSSTSNYPISPMMRRDINK